MRPRDRITHYPYLRPRELPKVLLPRPSDRKTVIALLSESFGKKVLLLNSARTGIYLPLAAYGIRRWDEVLVPRFMFQDVLNTINKTGFPATRESELTKAILVFHQFGYPQKMDELGAYARSRGWLIIEDCTQTMASKYKGRLVGSFGDAAVFSYPKIFPTILGGCLVTEEEKILDFAQAYLQKKRGWTRGLTSNFALFPTFMINALASPRWRGPFERLLEVAYSQYLEFPGPNLFVTHLVRKSLGRMEENTARRRRNLEIFKEYFLNNGYPEHLEEGCEVVPFTIPYYHEDEGKLAQIVEALAKLKVETVIYHFDFNRNMLKPDYRKCVPIPAQQGVSEDRMHAICKQIAQVVGLRGKPGVRVG